MSDTYWKMLYTWNWGGDPRKFMRDSLVAITRWIFRDQKWESDILSDGSDHVGWGFWRNELWWLSKNKCTEMDVGSGVMNLAYRLLPDTPSLFYEEEEISLPGGRMQRSVRWDFALSSSHRQVRIRYWFRWSRRKVIRLEKGEESGYSVMWIEAWYFYLSFQISIRPMPLPPESLWVVSCCIPNCSRDSVWKGIPVSDNSMTNHFR